MAEPFGRLDIPGTGSTKQTANYTAAESKLLQQSWALATYLTEPGTGISLERPTEMISEGGGPKRPVEPNEPEVRLFGTHMREAIDTVRKVFER